MKHVRSLALLVLAACGSKDPAPPTPAPPRDAPPALAPPVQIKPPVHRAPTPSVSRAELVSRLHASTRVVGIDFESLDFSHYLQPVLDAWPCTASLLANTPHAVLAFSTDADEAIVANISPANRTCIAEVARALGLRPSVVDKELWFASSSSTYRLRWEDGLARVTEPRHEPTGSLSATLAAQIDNVPDDAGLWLVSSADPSRKLAQWGFWIQATATEANVHAVVEGTKRGAATKELRELVTGLREGAAEVGVEIPEDLFVIKEDGLTAHLEAHIPVSVFTTARAPSPDAATQP